MCNEETKKQEERFGEIGSVGTMQGIPPARNIHHANVIDLRGVPAEHVQHVEEIGSVDALILDEANRFALQRTRMHHVRSVVVATPEERLIVTPQLDVSRSGMESMTGSPRLLLVGNLLLRPDVSAPLVVEKIESIRLVGILVACEGVLGALLGKLQIINGVTLTLRDDIGPIMRDVGETYMTPDYLSSLPDGTTYLNFGKTLISSDTPTDLVRQKILSYYNVGETIGPMPAISMLQARCPTNIGSFKIER